MKKKEERAVGSPDLDALYGPDYFYGKTSGYPPEGYAARHPDWKPWLDLIQQIVSGGRLVDLGCAYGYLVGEALARGFESFGLDISSHALAQEPLFKPRLARADLCSLPLPDRSAAVVCVFDVLEHLDDPLTALGEAVRVLETEGLLIGATPDPLYFSGEEATHVFERPPSFWITALRAQGLTVRFRFSVEDFNFQFVAARSGSVTAAKLEVFQHDYFASSPDFVQMDGALELVPRVGWGSLRQGSRRLAASPASLYVLNSEAAPQECRLRFQVRHRGDFGGLRVRFNSLVAREVVLDSETTVSTLELPDFLVPAGGHHLFFELLTPGVEEVFIGPLKAESRPAESSALVESLPFDLYQRYRFAAQAAEVLGPGSVLDVGGYLGDAGGHLATTADFFNSLARQPEIVASTDARQGDFPAHTPALAWDQPFEDQSFDLVMSLDVLEHLPPARRPGFLQELERIARRWIVLAAPCQSPEVDQAEQELSASLMQARAFLREHRELGLPSSDSVREFFEGRGRHVYVFPNGYLPRWIALQGLTQYFFGLHDAPLFQEFNRLYNRQCYRFDLRAPAYRTFWLVCREPLPAERADALTGLLHTGATESLERLLLGTPAFLRLQQQAKELEQQRARHWRDTQFLINERQKLIRLQTREITALRTQLEETPLWRLARQRWKKKGEA